MRKICFIAVVEFMMKVRKTENPHEIKHFSLKKYTYFVDSIDFESQIAESNINDDQVLKLIDYDSYFTLQEKRLPDTKLSILQTLANEDLIKKSTQGWDVLNLGAILFAKDLKNFKDLKRKAVRVIVYQETSRINALKEQEGAKGYASGFEGLADYIMDIQQMILTIAAVITIH